MIARQQIGCRDKPRFLPKHGFLLVFIRSLISFVRLSNFILKIFIFIAFSVSSFTQARMFGPSLFVRFSVCSFSMPAQNSQFTPSGK
jgi:hypothetical protein